VVLINKVDSATPQELEATRKSIAELNPAAKIVEARSDLVVERPVDLAGKRVLVVEDGPTLTHGGMAYGAGTVFARRAGAAELVDPRPYAVGSIAATYRKYPHMGDLLPAMGYSERQVRELAETIAATPADVVLIGTPIDLGRLVHDPRPMVRVRYELSQVAGPDLAAIVTAAVGE
jgi:predicted GTPase